MTKSRTITTNGATVPELCAVINARFEAEQTRYRALESLLLDLLRTFGVFVKCENDLVWTARKGDMIVGGPGRNKLDVLDQAVRYFVRLRWNPPNTTSGQGCWLMNLASY